MNLEALALRNANAVDRIRKAALHLAAAFDLSEQAQALAEAKHRDPQIAALLEREAVADLLEGILMAACIKVGSLVPVAEPLPSGAPVQVFVDVPALDEDVEAGAEVPAEPDRQAEEPPLDSLIAGIGPEIAEVLRERGIFTPADLAAASDETLLDVPGLSKTRVRRIRQQIAALQHPEH